MAADDTYTILLRMRDELSGTLKQVAPQIEGASKAATSAGKGFDYFEAQGKKLGRMLLGVFGVGGAISLATSMIQEYRASIDAATKASDAAFKKTEAFASSANVLATAVERMQASFERLKYPGLGDQAIADQKQREEFQDRYIEQLKTTRNWLENLDNWAHAHMPGSQHKKDLAEATAAWAAFRGEIEKTNAAISYQKAGPLTYGIGGPTGGAAAKTFQFFKPPWGDVLPPGQVQGPPTPTYQSTPAGAFGLDVAMYGQQIEAIAAAQHDAEMSAFAWMGAQIRAAEAVASTSDVLVDHTQQVRDLNVTYEQFVDQLHYAVAGSIEGFLNSLAQGKASFKDFAKSLILDITAVINHMIAMQAATQFLGWLPFGGGGGPPAPASQAGGAASSGWYGLPTKQFASAGPGSGPSSFIVVQGIDVGTVVKALASAPGVQAVRAIASRGMTESPSFRATMQGAT